jgi:hypothetical protein
VPHGYLMYRPSVYRGGSQRLHSHEGAESEMESRLLALRLTEARKGPETSREVPVHYRGGN